MAKFRNLTTGNIVSTDNPVTIELMKKSSNYDAISSKSKSNKSSKTGEADPEDNKTE